MRRHKPRPGPASIAEARIWNVTHAPTHSAPPDRAGPDPAPAGPHTAPGAGAPLPIPPLPYGTPPPEAAHHPRIPPPPGSATPPEDAETDGFIPFADAVASPPSGGAVGPPPGPPPEPPEPPPEPPAEAAPAGWVRVEGAAPSRWSPGREERRGPVARFRALLTGDELDPGRPGLRVLIIVAVVAAHVAVAYWWRSRPSTEPLPAPAPITSPGAAQAPVGTAGARATPGAFAVSAPASPSPSATTVVVDVAGKVRHPGVVRLPPGSRVVDAIRAAGGVRHGVHTGALNLARVVADGEQILVGVSPTVAAAQTPPPGGASPGASPGAPISLNTGTVEQFDTLPGVGPVLAKRIVDYRTQHGSFHSVDELGDVQGIGPKRMADLKPLVTP